MFQTKKLYYAWDNDMNKSAFVQVMAWHHKAASHCFLASVDQGRCLIKN